MTLSALIDVVLTFLALIGLRGPNLVLGSRLVLFALEAALTATDRPHGRTANSSYSREFHYTQMHRLLTDLPQLTPPKI